MKIEDIFEQIKKRQDNFNSDFKEQIYNLLTHFYKPITSSKGIVTPLKLKFQNKLRLVFINGKFSKENSEYNDKSIKVLNHSSAKTNNQYKNYYSSNTSDLFHKKHEGLLIEVNDSIDEPLEIVYYNSGKERCYSIIKNILLLKGDSKISIVEKHYSKNHNKHFNICFDECFIDENSTLKFSRIVNLADESAIISSKHIHQKKSSNFFNNDFHINGGISISEIRSDIDGEDSSTSLNGILLPSGMQHFGVFTEINHNSKNTKSDEIYKSVLNHKASGVFSGLINVAKMADGTKSYQSNKNILLSEDAKMLSKPSLVINADEVVCSHGSATGQIDKEALFYLQSRGISKNNAIKLLLKAFFSDILNNENELKLKNEINSLINKKLNV